MKSSTQTDINQSPPIAKVRPMVMLTGFLGAGKTTLLREILGIVSDHFENDEHGNPIFTEEADESTLSSGLFYSGPALVHRNALFCFIYKFRSRFGVIAEEIAQRLCLPDIEEKLELYGRYGFMNRDLDCCTSCECAIDPDESNTPEPESFTNNEYSN